MSSSILRLRNLRSFIANFRKFENSCETFQRTVCTNYALFSSITKNMVIHDASETSQEIKNSDLGRVVDLGDDFDDLCVRQNNTKTFRPNNMKIRSKRRPINAQLDGKAKPKKVELSHSYRQYTGDEDEDEDPAESEFSTTDIESEISNEEKQQFKLVRENISVFRDLMSSLKCKKFRHQNKKIMLEGKRLISDAICAGHRPFKIYFSRFSDLRELNLPEGVPVTQISYKNLILWSDVVKSQGVIGIFKIPSADTIKVQNSAIPLTVICDRITDPGNLGCIVRMLSAVGCKELLLTTGSVDLWDAKVLRAGAGAHFRFPVAINLSWSDIEEKIPKESQIVLADNSIPECSENDEDQEAGELQHRSSTFKTSSELANNLPACCYSSFDFNTNGTVIILGGETSGLSEEAYNFAVNRLGSRVYLPMANGVESVNIITALSVLSYEFRRQYSSARVGETSIEDKNVFD